MGAGEEEEIMITNLSSMKVLEIGSHQSLNCLGTIMSSLTLSGTRSHIAWYRGCLVSVSFARRTMLKQDSICDLTIYDMSNKFIGELYCSKFCCVSSVADVKVIWFSISLY